MARLVARDVHLPLVTTDASVVVLAERLGVKEAAMLDRRPFAVVRARHVEMLMTLLP